MLIPTFHNLSVDADSQPSIIFLLKPIPTLHILSVKAAPQSPPFVFCQLMLIPQPPHFVQFSNYVVSCFPVCTCPHSFLNLLSYLSVLFSHFLNKYPRSCFFFAVLRLRQCSVLLATTFMLLWICWLCWRGLLCWLRFICVELLLCLMMAVLVEIMHCSI